MKEKNLIRNGDLQIDKFCHTVSSAGQEIVLSPKEFDVLLYLMEHPQWVFSNKQIYCAVWKEEPIDCANSVMCCISQLRKKLESDCRHPKYIHTVRGVGYKFELLSGKGNG